MEVEPQVEKVSGGGNDNGSAVAVAVFVAEEVKVVPTFEDPKWVGGTWDLKQFHKNGVTNWDAVIDAGELVCFVSLSRLCE